MPNSFPTTTRASHVKDRASLADRAVFTLAGALIATSVGFFCVVTTVASRNPGYFDRLLLAAMSQDVDPIETGSTEKADSAGVPAIPVPRTVRHGSLQPSDFQILMVFGDEAHLASPGELWRVKEGMIVPGLGRILAVEPDRDGGIVKAENATLKGVRAGK